MVSGLPIRLVIRLYSVRHIPLAEAAVVLRLSLIHIYIPVEWSSKKLELVDYRSAKNRFFVRVSGTDKTFVEKVFGNVEYIDAQGVTGELGFVTEVMTEEALENKKAAYGEVLNVIRVA